MSKQTIQVLGTDINVFKTNQDDYISLTDIARYKDPERSDYILQNRMRTKNSIEYLGFREILYNPNFKSIEFDGFKNEAGGNGFSMTPKRWIDSTGAIGIVSKKGKYGGGTFAHKDIAIKFASWISVEFELYLIKEFQRLKETEIKALDWSVKRFLTKINYKIHTDAIKDNLIPTELSKSQISYIYADEADVLNISLFSQTAKERRDKNPDLKGNMRDDATIEQLIVLANIESMNAEYIKLGLSQDKRLQLLNQTAISQMKSLLDFGIQGKLL